MTQQVGVTLRLARLKPGVRGLLERDGILEEVGLANVHDSVAAAVDAHTGSTGTRRG